MAEQPLAEGLLERQVVDAVELGVLARLREHAALDAHALGRDLEVRVEALEPVDEPRDAERDDRERPAPHRVERRGPAGEDRAFDAAWSGPAVFQDWGECICQL